MGYSTDIFLSEPAASGICPICHDVLKDAVSLNCGHTFCDECMKSCLSSNNPSCPNCRVQTSSSNPNYVARDFVDVMKVKCPDGTECEWTGQVKDLQLHECTCVFKTIKCSVDGCDHTCQRKDMADHLSSTEVKMRHMELKYDKKLREMEEKYERKFVKCNEDMQACQNACKKTCKNILKGYHARLASVEARIGPASNRSSSSEHNNTAAITTPFAPQISDVSDVIVEGCGVFGINGVYKCSGTCDGVPRYTCKDTHDGIDAWLHMYRFVTNNTRRWKIVRSSSFFEFLNATAFYVADGSLFNSFNSFPPRTGWRCLGDGVLPVPTVRPNQNS